MFWQEKYFTFIYRGYISQVLDDFDTHTFSDHTPFAYSNMLVLKWI